VRSTAVLMAVVTGLTLRPASSAPADIFSMPAPVLGAEVPKASSIKTGDASVATQTGAMTYSYPVAVPPGRNGMAPRLALNYSSHAAIYGGIAAGWSLDIPTISEDHAYGRLRTRSPEVEQQQQQGLDPLADDRFVSSLAGGRPLVLTGEAMAAGVYGNYRAQNDGSYARYERMNANQGFYWRVRSTDGTEMRFGEVARTSGCASISPQHAPLTTMSDPFGNEVWFSYSPGLQSGECRLTSISWGYNASAGINQPFASVAFGWSESPLCAGNVYPGSFRDYRTGTLVVTGASKLTTITSTAFPIGQPGAPEHTRVITLGYDAQTEQCNRHHAPYRSLTSIQESAWIGSNVQRVDLPPVTFGYGGVPMLTTQANPPLGTPWNGDYQSPGIDGRHALSWGYRRPSDDRWPTVEAMTLDVNGDGLIDRLINANSDPDLSIGACSAYWQRNNGPDASGNVTFTTMPTAISLPRLKWRGTSPQAGGSAGGAFAQRGGQNYEHCALNGQVTTFQNSNGLPGCHMPSSTCALGSNGTGKPYCSGSGTECHPGAGQSGGFYRTYLAYRWIDMDNDARPDLVAAVHGNTSVYDLERGNVGPGYSDGEPSMSGIPAMNAWPACPGQMDRCKEVGRDLDGARTCSGGLCTWNWATVNSVLTDADSADCFDFLARPSGTGTPAATPHRAPYTRCEGLYPWFIYWNRGDGVFATTPTVKYQPIPLESETGDSSLNGPAVISKDHAVLDVDGDGILDGVAHGQEAPNGNPHGWYVWLGDGSGGFHPRRYFFPTRDNGGTNDDYDANAFAGYTGLGGTFSENSRGLVDVNGDGMIDQWIAVPGTLHANVTLNDGTQQRAFSAAPLLAGEIDTPTSVRPGNDVEHDVSGLTGTAEAKLRTIDLDEDGRLDVVKLAPSAVVHWNGGGQFSSASNPYPHTLSAGTDGLRRNTAALFTNGLGHPNEPYWWKLESDLLDIDGNGILDNLYYEAGVLRRWRENTTAPPRTMTTINNGRGAMTTIMYASMHDSLSSTPTVTQDATLFAMDAWCVNASQTGTGCPKASPRAMWVVKSVTVGDAFAGTTGTTSYRYWYPRWGPDDAKRYGFRGFEEVQTTAQSGARTIQRYGFDVDWSGRLKESLTYADSAATSLRSVNKTTWDGYSLFAGAIKTYHPTVSEHLVCANSSTEATCTAAAAPGYARTTTTWVGAPVNGTAADDLLMVASTSLLQPATSVADGDRQTATEYQLDVSPTKYLVRPYETVKQHRVAGAWVTFAKHRSTWNNNTGKKLTDEMWSDPSDATRSISRYVYEASTGNLVERWKPKQNAAGSTKTTMIYDARKLFVETSTNEAGHVVDSKYEYGTGATIEINGPNERTCELSLWGPCPNDALHPRKQQTKVVVDGLGRTKERWETSSSDGHIYELFKLEQRTYVDTPSGSIPTSVTSLSLVTSPSLWRQQKTDIDGHGRPTKTTVYVQGTAQADQITAYVYRDDGTLQSVSMPDPSVSTSALVTYTYTFDTLGRPLTVRRPDSIASGVDVTYGDAATTTTEVASDATVASTKTETDKLGRVWKVHELTSTAPTTWEVTTYAYGPDDNVASITDPQGVVTSLVHDFAGQRTQITRGTRLWKYTYDRNGNVATEQVPSPNPTLDGALYTTSVLYDDLDRVTEKLLAPRAMSAADLSLFVAGRELFTYDIGFKGQLRYWKAFRPGANVTESISFNLYHDGSGRRTITNQTASIAGLPYGMTRSFQRAYNPNGTLLQVRYRDLFGPSGTNETVAKYHYDARGLPSKIEMVTPQARDIGVQTRNVAGLVTSRLTTLTGTMTAIDSIWNYDVLGRVTNQHIKRTLSGGTTTVARQELTYYGNDDVNTLRHHLGTANQLFTYQYDRRHQITGVVPTSNFGATYGYDGAGRLTQAIQTRTATPVAIDPKLVRSVNYVYGGVDPEQVTALTNTSDGSTYASYTYDLAGNQVTRSYPATNELWEYVYDGKDQLRRATKKVGGVVAGSEEYWYGDDGQRFAVVRRNASGVKTGLTWFIGDTEAHYTGAGAETKIYSHLSLGTPIARVARTSNTATSLEFQFHGLASHTLAAVAQDGTINASFSYAPFGEVIEATDAGGASAGIGVHKRRSNDKIEDDLTGLAYYGARYYDKTLIGWTQADPLYLRLPDSAQMSTPRRANIYAFTLNNALRYVDPDGLDPKQAGALSSYRSEKEVSEAGRAANMASDGWEQGCDAYMPSGWCNGSGGSSSSSMWNSDPCNGVTSVCNGPVEPGSLLEGGLRAFHAGRPSSGSLGTPETVAYLGVLAYFCWPCAVIAGAGMFGGNDEGSALTGALAAGAGCSGRGGGSSCTSRPAPTAIDRVVVGAGGSIKQAVTGINAARLSQSQAVQVITRVTQGSGRRVGGVVDLPGGARAVAGVLPGPGQPIVHVGRNGTASFGSATVGFHLGTGGRVITTVTDVVLR